MFAKATEEVANRIFTEAQDLADVVVYVLSRSSEIWQHEVRDEL